MPDTRGLSRSDLPPELDSPIYQIIENTLSVCPVCNAVHCGTHAGSVWTVKSCTIVFLAGDFLYCKIIDVSFIQPQNTNKKAVLSQKMTVRCALYNECLLCLFTESD